MGKISFFVGKNRSQAPAKMGILFETSPKIRSPTAKKSTNVFSLGGQNQSNIQIGSVIIYLVFIFCIAFLTLFFPSICCKNSMKAWQTTWRKVNTLWSSWCAEGQGQHDKIKSLCCMKMLHNIIISSSKTCNWRVREMSEIFKNARCLGYYFDPDYVY